MHVLQNNDIDYWRKFSSEYYAPCAKQRWCLSMCKNISQQALDLFTETAMESWCCSICGSKSSKGFEVTYEALPRLFKTNFESGMLDEIMFLGLPQEHIFPSGLIMLEYGKVVQESVYEKFRIVHEGKLRVIFRGDLKIVYWEFCAQCHEEFLQHQLIARQINDFVEAAQKYKSGIDNFDGSLSKDMHSSCNMFVTAEHQLARSLQLSLVNDLGFSRKHFRCLQISEVVGTMKDLITISQELGIGPIECLKNYSKLKEGKETRTANSGVTTRDGSDDGQEVLQFLDGHGELNRTLS
ncbi:unnamed protein product [Cuscuta campestris]|uniref:Uncharacterized protein n=1 Tax=Cuscuta campestris TaxID=132261 RepID=A0A484NNJ1_9ASTE|nr:unnamed protein product [Cuscuta campestris]